MSSEFFEGLAEAVTARRDVLARRAVLTIAIGLISIGLIGFTAALLWTAAVVGLHGVEAVFFRTPNLAKRRPRLALAFFGATSFAFCILSVPLAEHGGMGLVGAGVLLTSIAYAFTVTARSSKALFVVWQTPVALNYAAVFAVAALNHASLGDLAILGGMSTLSLLGVLSAWGETSASMRDEMAARRAAAAAALTEHKAWQVAMMAEELACIGHWRLERGATGFQSSQQVFRIFGMEPTDDTFPVDLALDLYHPDDREQVRSALERIFVTGEPVTLNSRIIRTDNEVRHVVSQTLSERDADGNVCAIFGVFQDVTEQVRAAETIQRSEAQFRRMAENAHDLITCTSATGELLYISPSLETIAGHKPEDIIGRQTLNFIHPDDRAMVAERLEQIQAHPDQLFPPFECRMRAKDGRWVWLEARPSAIIDPVTGEYQGVTDVIRDITERKAMETALNEARLEAERAAKVKGEFLANMSHELRTPLTSIIGFSQLLREDAAFSQAALDHIDRVVTASEVLLATVNDILDFSKLEAGQVDIRPEPVRLADIASDIVGLFAVQAKAKNIDLRLDCAEALKRPLLLDSDRLRQILLSTLR